MAEIRIGDVNNPIMTFDVQKFIQVSGEKQTDLIADELAIDTFSPTLRYAFYVRREFHGRGNERFLTASGDVLCGFYVEDILKLPYGTNVWYIVDSENRMCFHLEGAERKAKDVYTLKCVSIIGLFDAQYHSGGVYTGQRVADVIGEIFGGTVGTLSGGYFPISNGVENCRVSEAVGKTRLFGYLPYDTKRNNLHQILFATGASLLRDNENIRFEYIGPQSTPFIPPNRIYVGNTVKYDSTATGVEVTEHTYQFAYNESETELFNNTDVYAESADHALVVFSEPIKVETATYEGITVHELGQNYAVVSGKGTLSAVPYVHITRTLRKTLPVTYGPENIKKVSGCTLINALNSENTLERLFDFYTTAYQATAAVVSQNENTGGKYAFRNEFGDYTNGYLTRMAFNASSFMKADCSFILGFTPRYFGNNYNNSEFFTGVGSWEVPQALRESDFPYIRFALIGGGDGGHGGGGGEQGKGCWVEGEGRAAVYNGKGGGQGGKGGKGGEAGQGGKTISVAKYNVSNVKWITFLCGDGGAGGEGGIGGAGGGDPEEGEEGTGNDPGEGGEGSAGTRTRIIMYDDNGDEIGRFDTENGEIFPSGVIDLTQDRVFGLGGVNGTDGGKGGEGGVAAFGAPGTEGEDVVFNGTVYKGGAYTESCDKVIAGTQLQAFCGGAGGGGAAAGANGYNATTPGRAKANAYVWGGDAGPGASAAITPQTPTANGQGGDGGHGGGGGGTGGAQNWREQTSTGMASNIHDGLLGNGGDGSDGAGGAAGCWFCYY